MFAAYYQKFAKPLPNGISVDEPSKNIRIGAIFVFNDPRDWALDAQIIVDLLLSAKGVLGTYSAKNNDPQLPNRGFQQDEQPHIYFSNSDLWWASQHHLPRLGQGGFREALEGVWAAITGGDAQGVELQKTIIGKPYAETYKYAEEVLHQRQKTLLGDANVSPPRNVYMIGDNPESDIRGANEYVSPWQSQWSSILVRTGVFRGNQKDQAPRHIAADVRDAVQWALHRSGWPLMD